MFVVVRLSAAIKYRYR